MDISDGDEEMTFTVDRRASEPGLEEASYALVFFVVPVNKAGSDMLKDLAKIIAEIAGKKVVFEIPDAVEAAGYRV